MSGDWKISLFLRPLLFSDTIEKREEAIEPAWERAGVRELAEGREGRGRGKLRSRGGGFETTPEVKDTFEEDVGGRVVDAISAIVVGGGDMVKLGTLRTTGSSPPPPTAELFARGGVSAIAAIAADDNDRVVLVGRSGEDERGETSRGEVAFERERGGEKSVRASVKCEVVVSRE